MINISRKLFIIIVTFLLVSVGVYVYYDSKSPHLTELKSIQSIQDDVEDTDKEKTAKEEIETDVIEKKREDTEAARVDLPSIISDTIKSTLDFLFLKELRIVAIGDSLTQGVGDHTNEGGYIGILDRTLNYDRQIALFENYGKRGNRTDQLLKRLEEPEIRASIKKADIILLTIGANDIMQVAKENFTHLTLDQFERARVQYKERLFQIHTTIEDLNPYARIYLLGIYNPFKQYFQDIRELEMIVNDWNQTSLFITHQFEQATFIPVKDLFDTPDIVLFAEDHFHPNYHGYYLIAERVLPYLTDFEGENNEAGTSRNSQ